MTNRAAKWITDWRTFLQSHPALNIISNDHTWTLPSGSPEEIATNEAFWKIFSNSFPVSRGIINLNNGAVCSSPSIVEKAFTTYYSLVNSAPSFFIWKEMEPGREVVREGLAQLINCSVDEVAILRNATEALNNIIFGIRLEAGDEVVACRQDYVKAVHSWKQRELRDGIRIKWIEIDGTETNDEVIAKYVGAFTDDTRVLHLTHVINWNGQVLPVEQIINEAKKRNIKVLLDAAHSFAILETDMERLRCDYMATALHKWLSGPIPSGLIYVRKENITGTWPLASSSNPLSADIRKFEELSIQLMPNILGLGYAIEFHLNLGREFKEARLRHLRRYWTDAVRDIDGLKFNGPQNEEQAAVLVNIAMKKWEPAALEAALMSNHNIHVIAVTWENLLGIRVTPNIYTPIIDLDLLVEALHSLAK